MSEEETTDHDTGDNASERISVWHFFPTWFGFGAGMMMGAALSAPGGYPWYQAPLVMLAGLCVAFAALIQIRRRKPR